MSSSVLAKSDVFQGEDNRQQSFVRKSLVSSLLLLSPLFPSPLLLSPLSAVRPAVLPLLTSIATTHKVVFNKVVLIKRFASPCLSVLAIVAFCSVNTAHAVGTDRWQLNDLSIDSLDSLSIKTKRTLLSTTDNTDSNSKLSPNTSPVMHSGVTKPSVTRSMITTKFDGVYQQPSQWHPAPSQPMPASKPMQPKVVTVDLSHYQNISDSQNIDDAQVKATSPKWVNTGAEGVQDAVNTSIENSELGSSGLSGTSEVVTIEAMGGVRFLDGQSNNKYSTNNRYTNVDIDPADIDSTDINVTNEGLAKDDILAVPLAAISPDTLKTFVKVVDIARREYVEPVNDEQLFTNAMQGMLKNLDPYAEFLDAKSYENLQAFAQGDLAHVGIDVAYDNKEKNWLIQSIASGSPAYQAGIKQGYYLHQIDGVKLGRIKQKKEVQQMLSGIAGSMVVVMTSDHGRRKIQHRLQRTLPTQAKVAVNIDRGIAVIRIPVFQEDSRQQILDALVKLNTPIFGVVLDVRDNPGGVLPVAVDIASLFAPNMDMVQIENRDGMREVLKTSVSSPLSELPLILVQNRYSASAAEVLASGLQYHKRATVVGETSYGKGSVQAVMPVDDYQAVKLTVAHYLRADGGQIDGYGVTPDIALIGDGIDKYQPDVLNLPNTASKHNLSASFKHSRLPYQMPTSKEIATSPTDDMAQLGWQVTNRGVTDRTTTEEQAIDPQTMHRQTSHRQTLHRKTLDSQSLDWQTMDWQTLAVNILLEQNKYQNQLDENKKVQRLAKLNQQNRRLRNQPSLAIEQPSLSNIDNTPKGVLLVYPKSKTP